MIKREIIEKIVENYDIVELIGSYLPLKKVGRYYRTLCPFHHDTKPSFYINPSQQLFHCFGCKESGNVIHFIMKYEKMKFIDAAKFLAERIGISFGEEKEEKKHQELYEIIKLASNFYHEQLFIYPSALNYLIKKRKLSLETIKEFQLGYAPMGNLLIKTLRKKGYSEELLITSGLAYKKGEELRDWFFERLIFPIFNHRGKIIGFGGRTLEDKTEPKYLNSPETAIFKKGENLYGLYQTNNFLRKDKPILVEGYFDLLSLFDKGIKNLVAPLGTGFTIDQARLLKKYNEEIIILFDGDNAGREATKRAIEISLKVGLNPLIVLLPDGYDPDKYVNEKGVENLKEILKNHYDIIDFYLEISLTNPKIATASTISKKKKILREDLKGLLETINFTCDLVLKELYLNKISEVFNLKKEQVVNIIEKKEDSPPLEVTITNFRDQIIWALIIHPQYLSIIEKEYSEEEFQQEIKEVIEIIKNFNNKENITLGLIWEEVKSEELKKILTLLSFHPTELITGMREKDFKDLINKYLCHYYSQKYTSGESDEKILEKIYKIKKNLIKGGK